MDCATLVTTKEVARRNSTRLSDCESVVVLCSCEVSKVNDEDQRRPLVILCFYKNAMMIQVIRPLDLLSAS